MYSEITDDRILEQLTNDKELNNVDLRNADISAVTVHLENSHFEDANLEGANLKDANLYEAYLDGANFSGANLEGANFEKAIIRNANFTGANLKKTIFENIKDFRGTHFNGAQCNEISFTDSKLSDGDFTEAHFENVEFIDINFTEANLNGAHFINCIIEECVFRNNASQGAHFINCTIKGCEFIVTALQGAHFINCTMKECEFSETTLEGATFIDTKISRSDFVYSHLENTIFRNVEILSDVFDNCFFEGAIFENVKTINFDVKNLTKAQKVQLGISTKISLINKLIQPYQNIPLLIEIIRSDDWDPAEVDTRGNNALMLACLKSMEDVALELIATGKTNMYLMDHENVNHAFKIAAENNLTKVLNAFPKNVIDIRKSGFDTINQENMVIADYLKQNPYNLVFMINNNYYLSSKNALKKTIRDPVNLKYGCITAGEQSVHVMDDNIIYDLYIQLCKMYENNDRIYL